MLVSRRVYNTSWIFLPQHSTFPKNGKNMSSCFFGSVGSSVRASARRSKFFKSQSHSLAPGFFRVHRPVQRGTSSPITSSFTSYLVHTKRNLKAWFLPENTQCSLFTKEARLPANKKKGTFRSGPVQVLGWFFPTGDWNSRSNSNRRPISRAQHGRASYNRCTQFRGYGMFAIYVRISLWRSHQYKT